MSTFEIVAPKLGESVEEVTITKWFVKVNDTVKEDDLLFEVASDKVDSEIPSPVAGKIIEIKRQLDEVVPVGEVVAVIALGDSVPDVKTAKKQKKAKEVPERKEKPAPEAKVVNEIHPVAGRFYSPLVKSIAKAENIPANELEKIQGSGKNGRVRKQDVLAYLETKGKTIPSAPKVSASVDGKDQIIEMDRMRRLIADHMVMSKKVSAHVTAMVEADVTQLVRWRNKIKEDFLKREGQKLTYTHLFVEATAKALRDFPKVNSSVDGNKWILKKNINIGLAVALPSGNLIVPVIKNTDHKTLPGIVNEVNELAGKARSNNLTPDDIQGGTFTISNFGQFRNLMGTPIINQPQVAILATGSIEKKPAVVETSEGDVILPRYKMFLSLSYDHRVVDGMLGGQFLRRIADYLENFDVNRKV